MWEISDPSAHEVIREAIYARTLFQLQCELVKLQRWVHAEKQKIVVIFEGRDAAGKGGLIKRTTHRLDARYYRVVALGTPTERERAQWHFQRYVAHFPSGGEIVFFDRSWYNRAVVERVIALSAHRQTACMQDALLLDANDAFFNMAGYSRAENRYLHWRTMTPPELVASSEE